MSNYQGIKTLEVLDGADNYNNWIAQSLLPYINSPALEIGAGIGNISEYFSSQEDLVLTDRDPELVNLLQKKFAKSKNITIELLDIEKQLGKILSRFKTVYAINVLEHIDNDDLAFRNINKLLEIGGKLVILVPAKKFAYTKLDENLGHFRRYEKDELRSKLERSHFKVEKIEYFNILGLLSWLVRNKVTKNHNELKKSHVKIFDSIVPF